MAKNEAKNDVSTVVKSDIRLDDALKKLSEVVKQLEDNDCELEVALKVFEEGVALTRIAHTKLSEAEKKVEILTKASTEGIETSPL